MRLSAILLVAAILLLPAALAVGGFNGLSLLGVLCALGAVAAEFAHALRVAPLEAGEYSRLDRLDGLGRSDA